MTNPILAAMQGASQSSGNGILDMLNLVRSSGNPQAMIQNMAQNNPQMNQVMQYVQQNGGDAKTAFYNLAKQKGVNPNDILNMLR